MKTRILLIASLCLAACSPQSEKTESASAIVPESAPVIVSSAAPTSSATAIATIPAAFIGRWDLGPDPCKGEHRSDMQLDVTATGMTFYESAGTIRSVKVNSPTDVVAEVAMEGEGETWTDNMHMVLSDNGKTLTINEGKVGVRTRCS